MLIALTGATGRVGRRLLPRLIASGYQVRTVVRTAEAADDVAALGAVPALGAQAEPVVGDLRDSQTVSKLVAGADAVVHLAATFVEAETDEVNVEVTARLADAAAANGVGRFVFTSTNLAYPAGLGRPATEDDPLAPEPVWGAYARTKAAADAALMARADSDLERVVLRLSFVYGDGDPHLREALRWAVSWPGHRRFQVVHHADVAQAVARALAAPGIGGRAYNVGDLAPVSAVELYQVLRTERPAVPAPPEPGLPDVSDSDDGGWHTIVDTRRLRRELGFRHYYPSVWTAYDRGAI